MEPRVWLTLVEDKVVMCWKYFNDFDGNSFGHVILGHQWNESHCLIGNQMIKFN